MSLDAIVYTSQTGFTAAYATLLAEQLGLPCYASRQAQSALAPQARVVYLGWVMAGNVKGLAAARKAWNVCGVCAVGMTPPTDSLAKAIASQNQLADIPVFCLQGGFAPAQLHGMQLLLMRLMRRANIQQLQKKAQRTPAEDDLLALWRDGGTRVCAEALYPIETWCHQA